MGNTEIRRFTKNDWYGWAGAEFFSDKSEPFIYEKTMNDGAVELTVIADPWGLSINLSADGDPDIMTWGKVLDLTPIRAEGELRALVKVLDNYTYAPDLSYAIDHESDKVFEGFEYYG